MTDVFICYDVQDKDIQNRVIQSLSRYVITTWTQERDIQTGTDYKRAIEVAIEQAEFDQESISTGVDFENEIFKGINGSDNFLFVLSPDAVESEYCEQEVNYAAEQNKRFITVLHRELDPTTMPKALRVIHWIDFKDSTFEKSFSELIQAIELDREHAHQHTVLQQRASDWVENNRLKDFLLNITACTNAERWRNIALEEDKQPIPTPLQRDFIQESRNAINAAEKMERRRRNIILGSVTGGMILAVILAGFAFFEMKQAEEAQAEAIVQKDNAKQAQVKAEASEKNAKEQAQKAKEQAQIALIRQLSAQAVIAAKLPSPSNGSLDLALLLAGQLFHINKTAGQSALLRVIQNPQVKTHLYGHTNAVISVAISSDGKRLASASYDKTVRMWDVEKQAPLGEPMLGHTSFVRSVAFSPDGKHLASASYDKAVRLWDVETQAPVGKPLLGHISFVLDIAFSPDGKYLASASDDNNIILWDVETQTPISKPLLGHTAMVNSIVFSPNGKLLASAGFDKAVRLWDVKTQASIGEPLLGHTNWVLSVAFSPNGKRLASASKDNTIRLWDIDPQSWLHRACQIANRNLSQEEWRTLVSNLIRKLVHNNLKIH